MENEAKKEETKKEYENINIPNNIENEKEINEDTKKIEIIEKNNKKEGKKDCLIF